jgi:diguanylate cyclase (GGDEF)-like protein
MSHITHLLLRLPPWRATALVVAASVLGSIALTTFIQLSLDVSARAMIVGLVIATVVPVTIATPVAGVIVSLMHRLDAARREAQRLASTDLLTGALNRRRFIEVAERELARAQHDAASISVLLLDVDDFKQVNDRAGHEVGDEVLRAVSSACSTALRPGDPMARWGGEEFVALLPGAGPGEAIGIALRVRDAIAGIAVPAPTSPLRVTASVGVASRYDSAERLDALISRADRAMYEAKRRGKNGAVVDREQSAG